MPNPENIEPHKWKKGQSGNPRGRPKGRTNVRNFVEWWLSQETQITNPIPGHKAPKFKGKVIDEILLALLAKARKGNVAAISELFDRLDGRPGTSLDLTTKGEPINKVRFEIITEELDDDSEKG